MDDETRDEGEGTSPWELLCQAKGRVDRAMERLDFAPGTGDHISRNLHAIAFRLDKLIADLERIGEAPSE